MIHCGKVPKAKWRNWQTHQTQNLALFTQRVGSTPTFATTNKATHSGVAFLRLS